MKVYNWRKNFSGALSNQNMIIRGKLAFKTRETNWLSTESPIIIPISIQSAFHEGMEGELKMNAFLSIIKSHVKGKITVLLTDKAHLQVASLKYQNNYQKAFDACLHDAQALENRFRSYFDTCHVAYWHRYISEDSHYPLCYRQIMDLYEKDPAFQNDVYLDAESTYTSERANEFGDKALFIDKSIHDILEQCTCLLVLANKGYRFQFYPGRGFASIDYVNRTLLSSEKQISFIDVFLTMEKKAIIPLN